ncbi:MAG: DinB family protein [Bacteroidetes bacterium]|nr:DinB family protein [Bacteroidota bacterium]
MLLNLDSVPSFYKNYVKLIEEPDLLQALRISGHRLQEWVHSIPQTKADWVYAPGKWTIRETLCHVIDAERIFVYRALRFARNDKTELPGFDERDYTPQANASGRPLPKIAAEMAHLRTSTIDLFESFTPEMLTRKGIASGKEISVMALGFIIAGHETHHRKILQEYYLAEK